MENSNKAEICDYSDDILKILEETTDIYLIENKLRDYLKLKGEISLNEQALERLAAYFRIYSEFEHVVNTNFNDVMYFILSNTKPVPLKSYLATICEITEFFEPKSIKKLQNELGYNKIYSVFKTAVKEIFQTEYSYKYLALLIRLLENDKLVYKNLKNTLERLVKYVSNELVEKNISNCCKVLSAVILETKDILSDKFIISILSFLVQILYVPKNYLFLSDKKYYCDIITCINIMFDNIFKNNTGYDSKKYITGIMREITAHINIYINSLVLEEMLVVVNQTSILSNAIKLYISLGYKDFSFIDSIGDILNPGFVEKYQACYNTSPEKINLLSDSIFQNETNEYLISTFLKEKYKVINTLNSYCTCFDRQTFLLDLKVLRRPVSIFNSIENLIRYIDWSDLLVLANSGDQEYKLSFLKFIFSKKFLEISGHQTYIEMYFDMLDADNVVLLADFACKNFCDFFIYKSYFQTISIETSAAFKCREIILNHILSSSVKIDVLNNIDIPKISSRTGYLNLLLLLVCITVQLKPKKVKNRVNSDKVETKNMASQYFFEMQSKVTEEYLKILKVFTRKYIVDDNPYNEYFIAIFVYIDENPLPAEIQTYYDLVFSLLYSKLTESEINNRYKAEAFHILLDLNQEQLHEIKVLSELPSNNLAYSKYLNKYHELISFLDRDNNPNDIVNNMNIIEFDKNI